MPLSLLPTGVAPVGPCPAVLVPLLEARVCAGFPSPADDYSHRRIDLNELLIQRPSATFFIRASGESMDGAKKSTITDGDLLVVDRSREPQDGNIVVATVNNEQTVKRFRRRGRRVWLEPENEQFPVIELRGDDELVIEGVVCARITQFIW
jgi:DNA polymerase V